MPFGFNARRTAENLHGLQSLNPNGIADGLRTSSRLVRVLSSGGATSIPPSPTPPVVPFHVYPG